MLGLVFQRKKLLEDHKLLGRWGEKRARKYLKRRGYRFLADNQNFKTGEIDLVMLSPEGTVVFVEVKTRAGEDFVPVETALSLAKKKRLTRAARSFIAARNLHRYCCRFDLVAIVLNQTGEPRLRHYESAFVPV